VKSGLANKEDLDLIVAHNFVVEAACSPGVELAIGEDDIGDTFEISLDVFATEVVPHPCVPRSQVELLHAVLGERIVIERLGDEHGVGAIAAGHAHLVASEDVPTVTVKVTCGIGIIEVCAVGVRGVIEEVNIH
jgi:hypothetical protein